MKQAKLEVTVRAYQEKVQSNEKLLDYNSTNARTVFQEKKAAKLL